MSSFRSVQISLGIFFAIHLISAEIRNPVLTGSFGGNKTDRENLIQELFKNMSPEQTEAVRDEGPLLIEAKKEFNKTMLIEVHSYLILLSSLGTGSENCDNVAKQKAEELIRKKCEESIACLTTYRNEVLKEAAGLETVRQLPLATIIRIVKPLDKCLDDLKKSSVNDFGHILVSHSLCINKV